MSYPGNRLLQIAGICSFLAPVLLLFIDLLRIFTGIFFEWTIGMFLAFVLFVPAVIGLTYMLMKAGSRVALIGGAFAFFGAMAGAGMQALFRTHAVLEEQGSAAVVEQLRSTFKLVAATQMIGLTWPIGLALLAVSYYMVRRTFVVPLLLLAAAVFFPIGRIAGADWAVIASGALFVAVFGMIGKQLLEMDSSMT